MPAGTFKVMSTNATTLPDDILQIVVEKTAELHGTNELIRLFPTSRSFKEWAERVAFRKVVVKSQQQMDSLILALNDSLPFCRPARHIVYLWHINADQKSGNLNCDETLSYRHRLRNAIASCSQLLHLAINGPGLLQEPSDLAGQQLKLMHLSIGAVHDPNVTTPYKNFVSWKSLTHLHLYIGSNGNPTLFGGVLDENFSSFESLRHLLLELTYDNPSSQESSSTYASEWALFSVLTAEDLIRRLLVRCPELQQVIIKSNFKFPRFLVLWDDLQARFRDMPQVTFKLESLPGESRYADTLQAQVDPSERLQAWQVMMQGSLEAASRLWEENAQVSSFELSLYNRTLISSRSSSIRSQHPLLDIDCFNRSFLSSKLSFLNQISHKLSRNDTSTTVCGYRNSITFFSRK